MASYICNRCVRTQRARRVHQYFNLDFQHAKSDSTSEACLLGIYIYTVCLAQEWQASSSHSEGSGHGEVEGLLIKGMSFCFEKSHVTTSHTHACALY